MSISDSKMHLSFPNKEEILCLKQVSEVVCERAFELQPEHLDSQILYKRIGCIDMIII